MGAKDKGMALLEVLAAISVLALGGLAAAALHIKGAQASVMAQQQSQALQLAQGVLERGRAAGALAAEQQAWQAALVEALGASAQGRIAQSQGSVQLQVSWLAAGEPRQFQLQGRITP